MVKMAKVFRNGASQAIRLPKEFRFAEDEVCIQRVGSIVVLYPRNKAWDVFRNALGKVDEDFLADRNQPMESDKRAEW